MFVVPVIVGRVEDRASVASGFVVEPIGPYEVVSFGQVIGESREETVPTGVTHNWGRVIECGLSHVSIEGVVVVAGELVERPAHYPSRVVFELAIINEVLDQLGEGCPTVDDVQVLDHRSDG